MIEKASATRRRLAQEPVPERVDHVEDRVRVREPCAHSGSSDTE